MKKVKPSKDKLEEYKGFINALNGMFNELPDGAYLALMEDETRRWLKENKIKANALDFIFNTHQRMMNMQEFINFIGIAVNAFFILYALRLTLTSKSYIDLVTATILTTSVVYPLLGK